MTARSVPRRWSVEAACEALTSAGVACEPSDVNLEPRDGRHLVRLAYGLLAWFADDEPARQRMIRERRALRLIASRCTFAVPRIVFESEDASFDLREAVPGLVDPWLVYEKAKADSSVAVHIGSQLGAILAEQHTKIDAEDAAAWLPSQPSWPEPIAWIQERLPRIVDDATLLERIDELLARYDAVAVAEADHVLVHADIGFHNVAFDPVSYDVRGVFDYDGAAWADRHFDFRYLPFALGHEEMVDAALAVYEPSVGLTLSRERIRLYNAAAAVTYLAYRDGVAPEQRWCGRTLSEDLDWVRYALGAAAIR